MLCIAKIASYRTRSPGAGQQRKLVAAGEIPRYGRVLCAEGVHFLHNSIPGLNTSLKNGGTFCSGNAPPFFFYSAGECFPLYAPLGCREQGPVVRFAMLEDLCPQYLQVYCVFSDPSYGACFPLFEPSGCRVQIPVVRFAMLENFCPQYLQ